MYRSAVIAILNPQSSILNDDKSSPSHTRRRRIKRCLAWRLDEAGQGKVCAKKIFSASVKRVCIVESIPLTSSVVCCTTHHKISVLGKLYDEKRRLSFEQARDNP